MTLEKILLNVPRKRVNAAQSCALTWVFPSVVARFYVTFCEFLIYKATVRSKTGTHVATGSVERIERRES